jgi:2-dehydro-3-deoxyphosphogluconate aldolase/(4S)-4-hydroxy-2-oxoglutarate aldolase
MLKDEVRRRITEVGIVPVVRASSPREALDAVEAVCKGGIRVVEITMTVPGAVEIIRELLKSHEPDVLVGAGTVLNAESARRCLDAGAQFIVSPGLNLKTIELAQKEGVLVIPGAFSPTEIIAAWDAGADLVKVFPCGNVGGPKYIKALKGPLPQIPLIPTGGVTLENAEEFILAGSEALGVGGELVQTAALRAGKPEIITEVARKFVEIVKKARGQNARA